MSPSVRDLARLRLATGCTLILVSLVGLLGGDWDVQWHATVGRDRTFTPPHDLILIGIGLSGIVALISILIESVWSRRRSALRAHQTDFLGVLRGSLGSYLVGFGAVSSAVAFPLDTYWHSLYGIDVSLWAPFHVMIFMGSLVSAFGVISILLSAAGLAETQHDRWTTTAGLAGLMVALGVLLSRLLSLLTPSITGHQLQLGSLTLSLYPFLMALAVAFVCVLAARVVPWPGAATTAVVAFLLVLLLVRAFVPPMMALLVQVEHETYLPRAARVGSAILPLAGQTPAVLLTALGVDAVTWLGRRRGWRTSRRDAAVALAATLSTVLVAGLTLLQIRGGVRAEHLGGLRTPFSVPLSLLMAAPGGLLGNNWSFLVSGETAGGGHGGRLRSAIQLVLCASAAGGLALTGVAFYQIVLASAVHGAPARLVDATAGPYPFELALYDDPIQAGAVLPFTIAAAPGTRGPLTYQVTASPGPLIVGSLAQGDVAPHQRTPHGVPGSITLVTRGSWTLHVAIDGPAGRGQADIPLTAVTFPAVPAWLAWNVGLLPLYGLLLFWMAQAWRATSSIDLVPTTRPARHPG